MTLMPWDDAMSDGCSVPHVLRFIIKQEDLAETKVCVLHDKAYYYGGSSRNRAEADHALRIGLIKAGMPVLLAWGYWLGVRIGGHPMWKVPNVSWSFGATCFKYSEKPHC